MSDWREQESGSKAEGPKLEWIAPAAIVALTAVLACRLLDDFDTWWHLAAGRWIVAHRAIPTTDVLSYTVRDRPWTNLQWGFDAALYLLHAVSGPVGIEIAAVLGFATAVALLLGLLRLHAGWTGAAVLGLVVTLAMQERFAVRPELLSFPLLTGVLRVIEDGRRQEGRGLWRLVPLMALWVNVHALFILGLFAIACALGGGFLTILPGLPSSIREGSCWDAKAFRKLRIWAGASLGAVFLNPFGFRGVLFPGILVSRINRSIPAFSTIAEFRSPFDPTVYGVAVVAYKALLFAGCATILASLVAGRRTRDAGGLAFVAGLAALSWLSRRNMALFALGASPFIARAGADLATGLPPRARRSLSRAVRLGGPAIVAVAIVLGAGVVTGGFYRWDRRTHAFGAGIGEGAFPVRAAAFVREMELPGKLYNDLAVGGYLSWDDPIGDGVFIDGRLEVYGPSFFSEYVTAMYDQNRWDSDAERFGIQTAILFHHFDNRRQLINRILRGGAWTLVYLDEVAAVLVRTQGNEAAITRALDSSGPWVEATRAWIERPVPGWRYPGARIEALRSLALLQAMLGKPEGAADLFARLLDLNPGDAGARMWLRRLRPDGSFSGTRRD